MQKFSFSSIVGKLIEYYIIAQWGCIGLCILLLRSFGPALPNITGARLQKTMGKLIVWKSVLIDGEMVSLMIQIDYSKF